MGNPIFMKNWMTLDAFAAHLPGYFGHQKTTQPVIEVDAPPAKRPGPLDHFNPNKNHQPIVADLSRRGDNGAMQRTFVSGDSDALRRKFKEPGKKDPAAIQCSTFSVGEMSRVTSMHIKDNGNIETSINLGNERFRLVLSANKGLHATVEDYNVTMSGSICLPFGLQHITRTVVTRSDVIEPLKSIGRGNFVVFELSGSHQPQYAGLKIRLYVTLTKNKDGFFCQLVYAEALGKHPASGKNFAAIFKDDGSVAEEALKIAPNGSAGTYSITHNKAAAKLTWPYPQPPKLLENQADFALYPDPLCHPRKRLLASPKDQHYIIELLPDGNIRQTKLTAHPITWQDDHGSVTYEQIEAGNTRTHQIEITEMDERFILSHEGVYMTLVDQAAVKIEEPSATEVDVPASAQQLFKITNGHKIQYVCVSPSGDELLVVPADKADEDLISPYLEVLRDEYTLRSELLSTHALEPTTIDVGVGTVAFYGSDLATCRAEYIAANGAITPIYALAENVIFISELDRAFEITTVKYSDKKQIQLTPFGLWRNDLTLHEPQARPTFADYLHLPLKDLSKMIVAGQVKPLEVMYSVEVANRRRLTNPKQYDVLTYAVGSNTIRITYDLGIEQGPQGKFRFVAGRDLDKVRVGLFHTRNKVWIASLERHIDNDYPIALITAPVPYNHLVFAVRYKPETNKINVVVYPRVIPPIEWEQDTEAHEQDANAGVDTNADAGADADHQRQPEQSPLERKFSPAQAGSLDAAVEKIIKLPGRFQLQQSLEAAVNDPLYQSGEGEIFLLAVGEFLGKYDTITAASPVKRDGILTIIANTLRDRARFEVSAGVIGRLLK